MKTIPIWTESFYQAINPTIAIAGYHKAYPGWDSGKLHKVQTDFDLWYIAKGSGSVKIDGCWHDFTGGELITIRPGSVYQREKTAYDDPFTVYFAHLLPFGFHQRELMDALAAAWPLRLPLRHRPEIVCLFHQVYQAFQAATPHACLEMKSIAMQMLGIILAEIRQNRLHASTHADYGVTRAKEIIEHAYPTEISLAFLADQTGLSRGHLCSAFTQHVGCPPIEYLLRVRVREAQRLLTTGMPIKDVAEAVGCHSQHYFSRLFHQRTGMSPLAFVYQYGRKPGKLSPGP